jgi:hypothetical protein
MKRKKITLGFLLIFLLGFFAACTDAFEDPFADPVEKYLGNWKATETSTVFGPGYVYNVTITRNPSNSTEVLISNFYMQGVQEKARALVTGNSLTILEQTICDGSIEIKGNGQFSAGRITLNYTAFDGADLDNVSATYTRQ